MNISCLKKGSWLDRHFEWFRAMALIFCCASFGAVTCKTWGDGISAMTLIAATIAGWEFIDLCVTSLRKMNTNPQKVKSIH